MSLDAFSSSSDYLNNSSTSSSTFAQPSQPQPQPQCQTQTQIAMPVGTLIPSTASESSHLKRTTSTLCISSLAAQQSTLHPNVSFAVPSPISDEERHDQMYYSHEEYTIDPNPVEEGQRHRHRGDSSRSRSPSRSRSVSFSSLSTTSSSSSFDMNRSFSSSSTATSDYDDDDDEDDHDDDDNDEESSVTSLSLSNTSRSSKHSATSTCTSFSSSRPQRPIFFLPPIYDCDEDEYPIIDTLPIPSSSLRSRSSSPRTRMRRQSKIGLTNKKAPSINLTPTPATITRKYVQTTRSSLFPLVDEPREELDALIDKIDRLGATTTTSHVEIGKDAFLELMIPSSEWQGDDYDEEDEEASSCRDCALDSAPSRSISISRPSSSSVGNDSVYHPVREGEDPLTVITPRLNAIIPIPKQRRRTHSRSSSTSSVSTITSASSPTTTHSSPFSPISSSPSFSSICSSPLQTSSPPLVVEPEDKPAKECQLVTYLESRSVIFPEPSPSQRSFIPISDYISLPPSSCTFSSDLPKPRPTRFSTPWQHLSRTSAQRALLAPRTSVRARTDAKVIKHDERVGRWSWGRMSVFSGEKGTDSFLPGPGDFLDMTDDDDEYVKDDDEDSDEEDECDDDDDDDDDDDGEDEDESLFDFDVSLHPKLRSRSQPETTSPPTRPIDSFLLPSGIPLPPLPFHPYFSPSYPTITKRKYVHRTRQASDPLFHRVYALENITAMKRRISPPRPFMDPELLARMRMRMHYYGYSSRCRGSHHDNDDAMIIPELEEIMMYGGIRWRSEIHRIKLLDRHRPLYTLYNNAWSTTYDGGRGDVEEEVIREGLERKCEIGRWVALNPGREDGRLRVGSSLRNVAFGPGAPDV